MIWRVSTLGLGRFGPCWIFEWEEIGRVRVVVTTDKLEVRPDKHVDCPPVPDR